MGENLERGREGNYTQDGSVDLKGNPVLRSKRGGWKACSFVVVYEVFERMAYHGISANLSRLNCRRSIVCVSSGLQRKLKRLRLVRGTRRHGFLALSCKGVASRFVLTGDCLILA
ncbi:Peptide transporter PTR3-A [Acorus calamus]|uniref:Peptide transporter PTR3-A n=1 Tax=Acorus calamus TaxID=4465 RepID=A0AAV9FGX1_ACOCL|nr:Peptide transporter PTR3-A [Acorus calamus]